MSTPQPKILVIMPAYNEAGVVGDVVREVRKELGEAQPILVIDDGSSDGTAAEARAAGARTISLIRNLGYGYALKTGYLVALEEGFDVVVQMDSDGQHAPSTVPALLEPILRGDADVVIGSRALSTDSYKMPFARRVGQRLFAAVLRAMCGLSIQDPTSGFQALGRRALGLFMTDDFPGDYPDTDILLYLRLHGVRIREVAALFRSNRRGKSMHSGVLKPAYYIYKMFFSMLLVYLRHRGVFDKEPPDGSVTHSTESSSAAPEDGRGGPGARRSNLDLSPGPGPTRP